LGGKISPQTFDAIVWKQECHSTNANNGGQANVNAFNLFWQLRHWKDVCYSLPLI
jgi:hypothetical protein